MLTNHGLFQHIDIFTLYSLSSLVIATQKAPYASWGVLQQSHFCGVSRTTDSIASFPSYASRHARWHLLWHFLIIYICRIGRGSLPTGKSYARPFTVRPDLDNLSGTYVRSANRRSTHKHQSNTPSKTDERDSGRQVSCLKTKYMSPVTSFIFCHKGKSQRNSIFSVDDNGR